MAQATDHAVENDNGTEKTRKELEETRSAMADKITAIHDRVTHAAQSVRDSVEQTVHDAKKTVHDGVQSVKDTFDLKQQAAQHPWPMIGGALFAGVVLANWTSGRRAAVNGKASHRYGASTLPDGGERTSNAMEADRGSTKCAQVKGFVQERFNEELNKVQTIAIGTGVGIVRDWLRVKAPALAARIEKEFDALHSKTNV